MSKQHHNLIRLTDAERNQLRSYLEERDREGWYYGNREQFERRHLRLKELLGMVERSNHE